MEMDFEIIILVYTDERQYMKGQNLVEKNQREKTNKTNSLPFFHLLRSVCILF